MLEVNLWLKLSIKAFCPKTKYNTAVFHDLNCTQNLETTERERAVLLPPFWKISEFLRPFHYHYIMWLRVDCFFKNPILIIRRLKGCILKTVAINLVVLLDNCHYFPAPQLNPEKNRHVLCSRCLVSLLRGLDCVSIVHDILSKSRG